MSNKSVFTTRIISIILAAAFVGSLLFVPAKTQAATSPAWKKAAKAYTRFLKANVSKFVVKEGDFATINSENYKKCSAYLICDMNQDGVPELVTWHDNAYKMADLYIFRFKNGKVKNVKIDHIEPKADYENNRIGVTSSAGGNYRVYKDKKGYLHVNYSGSVTEDVTYQMKKGKVTEYLYLYEDDTYENKHIYYVKGREVTKASYEKATGKLKEAKNSGMKQNK